VGGRRSQRLGPSPTLGSLGPSHHQRHKYRVSLRGLHCAHGVSGIPFGEVRDNHGLRKEVVGMIQSESSVANASRCKELRTPSGRVEKIGWKCESVKGHALNYKDNVKRSPCM